jgi:putative aldouronate transport system substrate-binding protein
MKKPARILIIFTLLACMLSACGLGLPGEPAAPGNSSTADPAEPRAETAASAENKLYTVDVFTMLGNSSGVQTGWFGKEVRDRFNIVIRLIATNTDGGEAKFATLQASGNLGDLVIFGNNDAKYLDSISGGLLLDMEKGGLLEKYGQEIVRNYPKVLEKARVNSGMGVSVYGLGYSAADMPSGPSEGEDMSWGPDLRWDLYARLGYPKLETLEDYLPVLKQMQNLEPRSESGWPTYGFSLWSDWDSDKMCLAKQYCNVYGYDETDGFNPYGYALVSASTDEYQGLLDPGGYYIKCLKLYFNANQMGLLDPDSISQKYEDANSKLKDGQVLFSWFPWMDNIYNTLDRQAQGKGFRLVPFSEEVVYSVGYNPYGGDRLLSIGANAKYPERILQLINWMYSPEGFQTIKAGPRGLTWDLDANGKPYLTDYGMRALPNNPEPVPEEYGGGTFKDGQNQMNIDPVQMTAINPATGEAYDYHLWSSYLKCSPTKLVLDWRSKMGVLTSKEYFLKNNRIAIAVPVFTGSAPRPMGKTLEQKKGQVATVIKQYSWKIIFAKDLAEYDTLLNEMIMKAKTLGYDDILQWNIEQAKEIFEWRRRNN